MANQKRLAIEDEIAEKAKRHAPWLINPADSLLQKFWLLIVTFVLQFELFCIPLVIIWPEMKQNFIKFFWFADSVWLFSILMDFVTIR